MISGSCAEGAGGAAARTARRMSTRSTRASGSRRRGRWPCPPPRAFQDHSHLIIDEVHERSIDTDILCLLARRLLHAPHHSPRAHVRDRGSGPLQELLRQPPAAPLRWRQALPVTEIFADDLASPMGSRSSSTNTGPAPAAPPPAGRAVDQRSVLRRGGAAGKHDLRGADRTLPRSPGRVGRARDARGRLASVLIRQRHGRDRRFVDR